MIRNEADYQEALKRLEEDQLYIERHKKQLIDVGLDAEQLKRALDPLVTFYKQLEEEVEWYEHVKRGDIGTIRNMTDLGKSLIALRIASGLSQKQLADKLSKTESQVSRDERNEYHNISPQRYQDILDALGASFEMTITPPIKHLITKNA